MPDIHTDAFLVSDALRNRVIDAASTVAHAYFHRHGIAHDCPFHSNPDRRHGGGDSDPRTDEAADNSTLDG